MGRTSLTNTEKIAIYCGKYPREFQRREGSLYRNLCKVTVSYDKVTRVNAHRANPTHKRKMEIFQTAPISFNRDSRAAHNGAEQIRARYPEVDSLIASVKAATVKNRRRRADFLAKNIPIPPQPILTRWGTWIDATCYYAENWEVVKEIVENWTGGLLVQRAKEDISQPTVFQNLIELQQYKKLPEYLKLLEHSESTIKLCYDTMKKFLFELDDSDPVKEYLRKRLENCIDLKAIINGTVDTSPAQINKLLNCLGSSANVERTFSKLKKMLKDGRNFLPENVQYYICIYCNLAV